MPDIIPVLIQFQSESQDLERCGVILHSAGVVELENEHPQPEKGFMMSGKLLADYGDDLAGTWHTHPTTSAHLSQDDYLGFGCWSGLLHYIAGTDGVRLYEASDDGLVWETPLA